VGPSVSSALRGVPDTALSPQAAVPAKFQNPDITAKGEVRAKVALSRLETLWINTGTLCNITCRNCYIDSSPTNDALAYIAAAEVKALLDEIAHERLETREIGFTGGEPFMNPDILAMLADALARGHEVLVLTNAMQPMQRPSVKRGLLDLKARFGEKLTLRVSLDHFTAALHEAERGAGTWARVIDGLDWLAREGFRIAIAGRTCWGESEADAREGYRRIIAERGWPINADDPAEVMLFPEMDGSNEVPEITTACWGLLKKEPSQVMCASSRMVVKRKGAAGPVVVPCTLLPYEPAFEMGPTLSEAAKADGGMFDQGAVKLCHPHCAKFCVLGGGSCS
jgi:sulfatase maturation enzyme AslB (radical SAM superfamily)